MGSKFSQQNIYLIISNIDCNSIKILPFEPRPACNTLGERDKIPTEIINPMRPKSPPKMINSSES